MNDEDGVFRNEQEEEEVAGDDAVEDEDPDGLAPGGLETDEEEEEV